VVGLVVRWSLLIVFLLLLAAPARADWNGDGAGDVLAIHPDGRLLMYRGNGAGGWLLGRGEGIGTGWASFTALLAPGDFSGDLRPDLLARTQDGALMMYRGDGAGGWVTGHGEQVGSGWQSFTALLAPGDFNGDGRPDVLARAPDGSLRLYRGTGAGRWMDNGIVVGSGWQDFTAVFAAGDFSGDRHPDVFARSPDGSLRLYRGNGTGGWLENGIVVGSGWQDFTALAGGGDFNGDGKPDVLARSPDGALRLYRGNGAGGWVDNGIVVGSGWQSLGSLTLIGGSPAPAPGAPAIAPLPGASTLLSAARGCTPSGGRLRVSAKIRHRRGRTPPHVRRIVFFVRGGPRRTDHRRPYTVRMRLNLPAGTRGRVYARIYFTHGHSRKVHTKTVSRTFTICG
jgi:FG-GAP-like repeat